MVYDYPEPVEEPERHIKVRVYTTQEIEYDVPKKWSKEDIENDIKENFDDFLWENVEIEDIEVE